MAAASFQQVRLAPVADGTLIDVKVVPGSSRDRVAGPLGARLKIAVAAPPEKGAANKAAMRLLAGKLGLRAGDVELAAGPARPEKTFLVRGLAPDEVRRRLESG